MREGADVNGDSLQADSDLSSITTKVGHCFLCEADTLIHDRVNGQLSAALTQHCPNGNH